jgi:hypothetical protein
MKKMLCQEASHFPSGAVHILRGMIFFLLVVSVLCLTARGQGTAISYQGMLSQGNNVANGSYDVVFTVYDTNLAGNVVGGPVTNAAVTVSNGLFQTTMDFGAVFDGAPRWLQISVRTNGGTGFTPLTPRQPLTPTPYAIYAGSAGSLIAGGVVGGNGAGWTNIPATGVTGLGTAATTSTNAIVAMAAATYGISQGISALALESVNPGYHDGWLSVPIGYNTWFSTGANVTENFITNNVMNWMMGRNGYPDMRKLLAPKEPYLQIDEGMFLGFDSNGIPTVDPTAFPDGFPWLANYIHTNGFAVGIWVQALGGDFNTQMTNYNAYVFANYLITNHVDYVKYDGVQVTTNNNYPYSDMNTNAAVLFTFLRAAQYPIYINSAIGGTTNAEDITEAVGLLNSFRSTTFVGNDQFGNEIGGDLTPGGFRPILQDQWVDSVMKNNFLLGNGLAADFDPLGSRNWPDAKRHISICTFFSSPFQWGEAGENTFAGYESVWTNLLSLTSIKIRRDQFTPYVAYTTNGVEFLYKQNTDGEIDVLLLNRNYQEAFAERVPSGDSFGPGYQMDLFTNYFAGYQYVFTSTNATVDFAALGLSDRVYTCYNASSDGRLTVTNGFNVTVPAASAQLYRIVPPVTEPATRYLSLEKWFDYTNFTAFPYYPYRNSFQGQPTVQLIGSPQIYSNGIVQAQGSRVTYGVNGAQTFSATFGSMTYNPSFYDNVTIFLDATPIAYFNSGVLTNFRCAIPPGTKTISIQGDSTGAPFCYVNPLLSSQVDGSNLTGLTAADGSAVVGQSSLVASNYLTGAGYTNGATANGQIAYSTNNGTGWFWATPGYDPAGAAQQATNHLPVLWTTNVVTAIVAGAGIKVTAATNAGGIVYTISTNTSGGPVASAQAEGTAAKAGEVASLGNVAAAATPATDDPSSSAKRTPAAVRLGTSPFAFTNTSAGNLECYFNGGNRVGVAKNGVKVFTATPCYLVLQPADTITITYAGAPDFHTNAW